MQQGPKSSIFIITYLHYFIFKLYKAQSDFHSLLCLSVEISVCTSIDQYVRPSIPSDIFHLFGALVLLNEFPCLNVLQIVLQPEKGVFKSFSLKSVRTKRFSICFSFDKKKGVSTKYSYVQLLSFNCVGTILPSVIFGTRRRGLDHN